MKFLFASKNFLPVLIVLLGTLVVVWVSTPTGGTNWEKKPSVQKVNVLLPKMGNYPENSNLVARVQSTNSVQIQPEVSGVLLKADFRLRPGQSFKKGDVLFRIENVLISNNYKAKVSEIMKLMSQALPYLKSDSPKTIKRWELFLKTLSKYSWASMPEKLNFKEKMILSRFDILETYSDLLNLKYQNQKHIFKAPFMGQVVEASVFPGDVVRPGQIISKISQMDSLEVKINLAIQDKEHVRLGDVAELSFDELPNTYMPKVKRIGHFVEKSTNSIPVYLGLNNLQMEVIPGMVGLLRLAFYQGDSTIQIPIDALKESELWVVRDSLLQKARVQVQRKNLQYAYILGGVGTRDLIVTEFRDSYLDSTKVQYKIVNP